jgi:hypothetical protein
MYVLSVGVVMAHSLVEMLAHHPTLTTLGFESTSASDAAQAERRAELLADVERFEAARRWIRISLPPQSRSRRLFSSALLKQMAEREVGPLSNGVFIAAMLANGHRYLRQGAHNPNAYFPLSTRRVVALDRRRPR